MLDIIKNHYLELLLMFTTTFVVNQYVKQIALREGLKALLRNELLQSYTYHIQLGWISINELYNFEAMYASYRDLGGNDIIEEIWEDLKELPTEVEK